MTREEACKAAEVMLAYANGKLIEYRPKKEQSWALTFNPSFEWLNCDYRIRIK